LRRNWGASTRRRSKRRSFFSCLDGKRQRVLPHRVRTEEKGKVSPVSAAVVCCGIGLFYPAGVDWERNCDFLH
jgi:hypothetical protein